MPKVIYISADGEEWAIDARVGDSVMATAVQHGIPGIIAECGGNCSCATCHVYVRGEFSNLVGLPGGFEDDLLDLAVSDRRDGSRLSCQICLTDALDGLTVEIPSAQL